MRDKNAEEKLTANNSWRFAPGEWVSACVEVRGNNATWADAIVVERVVESYWGEGRPIAWYEDEMYDVLAKGELLRVHADRLRATQITPTE